MAFTSFLDPVFGPLLSLHPALAMFIMSFLVTLLITIVYKYTTDQKKMKQLKDGMKESQERIKKLSKEDPQMALAMQGEAMSKNLEYMKHSFKATLWTMLPVLVIFLWMSNNMAYYPIAPNTAFTVIGTFADGYAPTASISSIPELEVIGSATQEIEYNPALKSNVAIWKLKGSAGEYRLIIEYNQEKYDQTVLISEGRKYSEPEKLITDSKLKKITVGNEKVYPLTLFGLKITWFWTYLLMSIGLSILIRKLMKVY